MLALAIAFLTSLLITLLVIRYQHLHAHVTADHDLDGVQKFHATPVPRVGGVGVYLGVLGGLLAKAWVDDPVAAPNLVLLACALPAFGAGLVEDLTKRVGVRERLMATAFSALLGGYFLGAWLTRLDIPGLDSLLHPPTLSVGWDAIAITGFLAIAVTAFAVAGVANAFNIIDGYNGLSGVVAIISLLGLAYVADQVGSLNAVAAAKVRVAVTRMEQGNLSNVEWFRGIGEYKIDWGPGLRIYLAKDGLKIIILIGGGTKKRQQCDIDQAVALWEDYKRRKASTQKGR